MNSTGLIQLFEGRGKGKTTAALGEIMRATGAGLKAAVVFFDKGGTHYSERATLDKIGVDWFAFGRDRIDPKTGLFDFAITEEDKISGDAGLMKARELFSLDPFVQYDLLVLDEINSSVALGIVNETDVLKLLDEKPARLEIILTGRNATDALKARADLVTEMRMIKHYYSSGVNARRGFDY